MPIGISEEHEELYQAVHRWGEAHCPSKVAQSSLDATTEVLPPFWSELSGLGWLGLHIDEAYGGEGFGLPELIVVAEELGRIGAPGPFVSSALAAAVIQAGSNDLVSKELLRGLVSGEVIGAVGFDVGSLVGTSGASGSDGIQLSGTLSPVLGAHLAGIIVLPVTVDGREVWCALRVGEGVSVRELPSLDLSRRMGEVTAQDAVISPDRVLGALDAEIVRNLAAVIISADAVGGAAWCVETTAEYAKVREQFGRPIGQFQAVKHRLADMLIDLERARAATWDAARASNDPSAGPITSAVAAALATEAFARCSKDAIQLLGGIGFTWEHDAQRYLKRAMAVRQILGGGSKWRPRVALHALGGARRELSLDLSTGLEGGSDGGRAEVKAFVAEMNALPEDQRRFKMADAGYLAPHWPAPWGRDAGALEQLVIDDEFAKGKLQRAHLAIGAWALPTIFTYGTPEQQVRWVRPTLYGTIAWCQLFSEPGAGSDLAALSMKAERADGGWRLTGQKVWTSLAKEADWGICIARTDPDVPKHEGITCFLIDMTSPGIDIRPLRELTGLELFNEVFMTDVFVPDDCVVGAVNNGWAAAKNTLANERVAMSSGTSFGGGVDALLMLIGDRGLAQNPVVLEKVGALIADAQALSVLGFRLTMRALEGSSPGPESSVRKLASVEHEQRVQEFGLELLGNEGSITEGPGGQWTFGFLANRCLTIAGGTSEVQRNVIGERLLGLPRDA